MIGRRILVLAPHPDDEVVGAGIALLRAQAAGATSKTKNVIETFTGACP